VPRAEAGHQHLQLQHRALIFGPATVSTGQMFIAGSNGTFYAFGL